MVSRRLKIHAVLRILCAVLLPAALISLSGCGGSIKLARAIHHSGEDWLVFGRDGQHTNRASTVLNPPLKLLWAYDASAGFGSGSPIVVDSVVFIGTLTGELHAVELATGKRIGYTSLGSALVGAPAISNGRIVVACAMGDEPLVAFDLHYGDRLWKKNITGVETSPVTYGDKIFGSIRWCALLSERVQRKREHGDLRQRDPFIRHRQPMARSWCSAVMMVSCML